MLDRRTRAIRVTFDPPPDPDRFSKKERCHFAVVVLFPLEVKRQLKTLRAAQARSLEIARQMIQDRIYKAPDMDALESKAEVILFDLFPLGDVHRVLDDGTKVWLSEAERFYPR